MESKRSTRARQRRGRVRRLGLVALLLAGALATTTAQSEQATTGQPPQPASQPLPWPVKLGARALAVEQAFPLIDRVVLVPDVATYVDELGRWSPRGVWPVLFEDDHLAAMFIRRFEPAEVVRLESVGRWPDDAATRRRRLESVVIGTWGGDPARRTIAETFAAYGFTPPGVVLASEKDPAWTAAVALAAGRGQPLLWLDVPLPPPERLLGKPDAAALVGAVDELVASTGYTFKELGDDLDAITLCRDAGTRLLQTPYPQGAIELPDMDVDTVGPLALTDQIGRHPDGRRYAVTGWIFGSDAACAYTAMCALFLPRQRVWLVDAYPREAPWTSYAIDEAVGLLGGQGFDVTATEDGQAAPMAWRRRLPGGVTADVIHVNSHGEADRFALPGGEVFAQDVPLLATPAIVHMVHSWSMRSPHDRSTVGGRWLEHGAYAYVGAAHEPYLQAFVPPGVLARRLISRVPFLPAGRLWQGPFAGPWRVVTFGDPLLTFWPPRSPRPRVDLAAGYGQDLRERARQLMTRVQDEPDEALFAEGVSTLVLLGRDDLAAGLWRLGRQQGLHRGASRAALGALFRLEAAEEFLAAWTAAGCSEPGGHDPREADMLWHLLGARLGPSTDAETLAALESAIRGPLVHVDLLRLLPALRRTLGQSHARRSVIRHMNETRSPEARRALEKALQALDRP